MKFGRLDFRLKILDFDYSKGVPSGETAEAR